MSDVAIAKLFMNGRSQAVRLPRSFRFAGDRVRVRRVAGGVLLEPIASDVRSWFKELDRFAGVPFMAEDEGGRSQPRPQERELFD